MKSFAFQLLIALSACLLCVNETYAQASTRPIKLVILGSSTGAGYKVRADSAYVNLLRNYLIANVSSQSTVINFSVSGYNTYKMQPSWYVPPDGQTVDHTKNIDAAIAHNPDAILVNFPSNDARDGLSLVEQQNNFLRVLAKADSSNIPVWITTTQPRSAVNQIARNMLIVMRAWIETRFGTRSIDFWTELANTNGSLRGQYDCGDGTHLNGVGHAILFDRVTNSTLVSYLSNWILPITLESFSVNRQQNDVLLNWRASGLEDGAYFKVEYSTDDNRGVWHAIATIDASDLTGSRNFSYVHVNANAVAGKLLYRIVSVNKDGSFKYSDAKAVVFNNNQGGSLAVSSREGKLVFTSSKAELVHFLIYDLSGRVLKKGTFAQSSYSYNLINRGLFIIKMYTNNGKTLTQKIAW